MTEKVTRQENTIEGFNFEIEVALALGKNHPYIET
jgi:DNA topoisomerase VI subunit B